MAVPCRKRLILAEEQRRGVGSEEVDGDVRNGARSP